MITMPRPTYELHDARVSRVSLSREGVAQVQFSHLPVYFEDPSGLVEHWSHTATLELRGVSQMSTSWVTSDSVVSDAIVSDAGGGRIDEASLQGGVAVAEVKLVFTDGSECSMKATYAEIVVEEKVRFVERFRW